MCFVVDVGDFLNSVYDFMLWVVGIELEYWFWFVGEYNYIDVCFVFGNKEVFCYFFDEVFDLLVVFLIVYFDVVRSVYEEVKIYFSFVYWEEMEVYE